MNKTNLFWAIITGCLCVTAIVGMFWNPSQWVTAVITGAMCGIYTHEYVKGKGTTKK